MHVFFHLRKTTLQVAREFLQRTDEPNHKAEKFIFRVYWLYVPGRRGRGCCLPPLSLIYISLKSSFSHLVTWCIEAASEILIFTFFLGSMRPDSPCQSSLWRSPPPSFLINVRRLVRVSHHSWALRGGHSGELGASKIAVMQ